MKNYKNPNIFTLLLQRSRPRSCEARPGTLQLHKQRCINFNYMARKMINFCRNDFLVNHHTVATTCNNIQKLIFFNIKFEKKIRPKKL